MSTSVSVDGVGRLMRVTAPFNEALETLKKAGAGRIVSFRDLAVARMRAGRNHLLFKADSFTSEAVICTSSSLAYFVRTSPLLDVKLANTAAVAHRKLEELNDNGDPIHHTGAGEIFFGDVLDTAIVDSILKAADEDAGKPLNVRRVYVHHGCDVFAIPTNRFAEHELTQWLYGDIAVAREYGDFLRKQRIFSCMVWLVDWLNPDPARRPFIRQLVMNGRNGDINGGRRLGWDDGHMGGTWGIAA